ncbi:MAG: hypothetical protein AAF195_04110 [Pseudomonadota bacterium]
MMLNSHADLVISGCDKIPTPSITQIIDKPPIFNLTNNLRRSTGSPFFAKGNIIYIKGVVYDKNCIPVPGAVIRLWQADSAGYYSHINQDNSNKNSGDYDKNFVGSGTAITDNNGLYSFVSVMPGMAKKKPPVLHFLVSAEKMGEINIDAFFDDKNNVKKYHPNLNKTINPNKLLMEKHELYLEKEKQDEGKMYIYNFIFDKESDYRHF